MNVALSWLRVALRDLRGDLRRFGILIACLALGVGTIALVGSVGAALQSALLNDARAALGGDIEAQLSYRAANAGERALFARLGTVTEVVDVMARATADEATAFVSIRAVDAAYPLVGAATVTDAPPDASLADLLASRDGRFGVVGDALLLDRLGLRVGDTLTLGTAEFQLRGVIGKLPDQIGQGVQLGIPVLTSVDGLNATGILEPGVLARYRYRIVLPTQNFEAASAAITTAFPSAGWQIKSPHDATADLARFFDVFARFLVIVGLSSLLVGGVGVSNAVSAYITERQRSIATLKALGAGSARVMTHFLVQIAVLTVAGIVVGLILGAGLALVILPILERLLAIALPPVLDPGALALAAGFGLLIGFAFAWLPLRRAQTLRPALLFRSAGSAVEGGLTRRDWLKPALWLPLAVAAAGIYGLAVLATGRPGLVNWYGFGAVLSFLLLSFAGWGLQRLLRVLPPPRRASLRNALKSIHRPGSPAPAVILSLGLGLALLLLIALIDSNLRHQLQSEAIPNAPSFVFMDLFEDEAADLGDFARSDPRAAGFTSTPMLRGAITAINGTPTAELTRKPPPDFDFVLGREVPITESETLPAESTLTVGQWWAPDDPKPQISVFEDLREPLGLKVGDTLKLLVFGEEIEVTIANFRQFAWRNGGINFAFVLSPAAVADFPLSYLGFLRVTPGTERPVQQQLVAQFPDLIFAPVSDAIAAFSRLLGNVTTAVEAIGGLAVVSGLFVLAGAMAAGRRQREADAVVMKVLGATRGDVVRAYLVEYGLLGLLAAVLAAGLGLAGTWAFVEFVLEIDFVPDPQLVVEVALGAIVLTIAVGVLTTWSALSVRPARFLREE